ncbi:MAG: hypothetical protein M3258_05930 [Thermoproteota archaeon]|nr:hypothetical protein [Thermoproteota archaeon]
MWTALAELAAVKGKKGLRVVGYVGSFFKHGYGNELVHYEELTPQFEIPLTAVCQYEAQDIYGKLSVHIYDRIKEYHMHLLEEY